MVRSSATLELLVSVAAGATIALLVLAGGVAVEAVERPVLPLVIAAEAIEHGIDPDDLEGASPREYLCCAFVNAESGASR